MAIRTPHTFPDGLKGNIVVLEGGETCFLAGEAGDACVGLDPRDGLWYVEFMTDNQELVGSNTGFPTAAEAVESIKSL